MSDRDARLVVRELCDRLLSGELNVWDGCRLLANRHRDGHEWIPIAFMGFDSELDGLPHPATHHLWDAAALERKLRGFPRYRDVILGRVRELRDSLDGR